jgi:hypothetical protein
MEPNRVGISPSQILCSLVQYFRIVESKKPIILILYLDLLETGADMKAKDDFQTTNDKSQSISYERKGERQRGPNQM